MLYKEDLLEKQPVLICNDDMNFEFDDSNEINEDTIIVTGFTVRSLTANKHLKFFRENIFWLRRDRSSRNANIRPFVCPFDPEL